MFRKLQITDDPEKLKLLVYRLKRDEHISKTFEGKFKNGVINGVYTNMALINGIPVGYTKIKGTYDLEKGRLLVSHMRSNLYWCIIGAIAIVSIILIVKCLVYSVRLNVFALAFLLFFALLITLISILEGRSFLKEVKQVWSEL